MAFRLNDPDRTPEGIFVALDSSAGVIASTVRVFTRRIIVQGGEFKLGGIGEVSTKSQYRRQGLASKLLQVLLPSLLLLATDFPIFHQHLISRPICRWYYPLDPL